MNRKFLIAGLLALTGTAAVAADLPVTYDPPAPAAPVVTRAPIVVADWTGFSIGAQGGYAFNYLEPGGVLEGTWATRGIKVPDAHGGFGGLFAAANWQFPSNLVVGGLIEANLSGQTKRSFNGFGDTARANVEGFGLGAVKVGYAYGNVLPYVLAGVGYQELKATTTLGGVTFRGTADNWGYALGAGVNYLVTPNVVLGVGYRFMDFDKSNAGNFPGKIGGQQHIVQGSVGYKW